MGRFGGQKAYVEKVYVPFGQKFMLKKVYVPFRSSIRDGFG